MVFRASRAVRHAVLAFDVDILRSRDLHLVDGEVGAFVTRHGRAVAEVRGDALALESTLAQDIALAERVGTREARELIAAVRAEGAGREATPVVSALLRA